MRSRLESPAGAPCLGLGVARILESTIDNDMEEVLLYCKLARCP